MEDKKLEVKELEVMYRYFGRRLKIKSKELKLLQAEKLAAVSEGTEKAALLKVRDKLAEIRVIKRSMDFMETGVDVEKETWDKDLPIIFKNEVGELMEEWRDGTIKPVKILHDETTATN